MDSNSFKDHLEWHSLGKYNSGKADLCSNILALFGDQLTEEVKNWLYNEQLVNRTSAITAFDKAIKSLEEKEIKQ